MASTRRKSAAIALAVIGVAGLSLAAAATLSVNSATVQAGVSVFTDCQPAATPITVGYTTAYSASTYKVTDVTLSGVDAACAGKAVRVTLTGTAGVSLGELTGNAATGAATDLSALVTPVEASTILGVAVVING